MWASIGPDEAVVDLKELERIEEFGPVVKPLMEIAIMVKERMSERCMELGQEMPDEPDLIFLLKTLEKVGKSMAEEGKTFKVLYKGVTVLVLGKAANSILMEVGGYNHVDIKRKVIALRLVLMLKKLVGG